MAGWYDTFKDVSQKLINIGMRILPGVADVNTAIDVVGEARNVFEGAASGEYDLRMYGGVPAPVPTFRGETIISAPSAPSRVTDPVSTKPGFFESLFSGGLFGLPSWVWLAGLATAGVFFYKRSKSK